MIEVFIERGDQLSRSRALMKDDHDFTSALALVSIHSAIAFNDALLVKLTGRPTSGEDHMEAVRSAKKQCRSKRIAADGLKQLEKLIAKKTSVSYGNERTTIEVAIALSVASERFEAWVRPLLRQQ